MSTQFKTVGCKYATSSTIFTFMTEFDCKVGDKAAVFTNGSWSVVTIVEIHDKPQLDKGFNYTYLVQIIDRTEYDRLVKKLHDKFTENQAMEDRDPVRSGRL